MKRPATFATSSANRDEDPIYSALRVRRHRWEAALCVSLAFIAITGSFSLAVAMLPVFGFADADGSTAYYLAGRGVILLFPVAFFAAHCLDELARIRRERREYACRQSGIDAGGPVTAEHA